MAPIIKKSSFHQRLPGTENSPTITSEQAMYTKLPAARLVQTIWTISPPWLIMIMPTTTPSGDAKEKVKISHLMNPNWSGNTFTRLIPRELEAAPLWIAMAITMFKVSLKSGLNPRASPSKMACTDKAIMSTNGVMFEQHEQHLLFFSVFSPCRWSSTKTSGVSNKLSVLSPSSEFTGVILIVSGGLGACFSLASWYDPSTKYSA